MKKQFGILIVLCSVALTSFGQTAASVKDTINKRFQANLKYPFPMVSDQASAVRSVVDWVNGELATRIVRTTSIALRSGSAGTPDVVLLTDKLNDFFIYNPANTTAADDSVFTINYSGRRYERADRKVTFEKFGATPTTTYSNETTVMQRAVNYLRQNGGGVIYLGNKIYTGSIYWNGSDHISMMGNGPMSAMKPKANNEFAIRIEGGFPATGQTFQNMRFYGTDDRKSHGVYLNCGSYYNFENVRFDGCGIGVMSNGTIDNAFNMCQWKNNWVAVMIATRNTGALSIPDVNGQTLTVSAAFTDTQPAEQTFTNCQFFSNKCHIYIDSPNSAFDRNANVRIIGGAMQNAECAIYVNQSINYGQYPLVIDNVWMENYTTGMTPFVFNGKQFQLSISIQKGVGLSSKIRGFSGCMLRVTLTLILTTPMSSPII